MRLERLSPLLSAEQLLETLWWASVSGKPPDPDPDDAPHPAVSILAQRMFAGAPPDWPSAAIHIEVGTRRQAAGDTSGGLIELGAAYAYTAPATACFLQIASLYLAGGQYDLAERWLRRKAGQVDGGSDADTCIHLAHAIWGSGRYEAALAVCNRLIERHPLHVSGVETAALMHMEQGDPRIAMDACVALLTALPDDHPVPVALAHRAASAAIRVGMPLPEPIKTRIAEQAARTNDVALTKLARRIDICGVAQRGWSSLFGDPVPARAMEDLILADDDIDVLEKLFAAELAVPVVGWREFTGAGPTEGATPAGSGPAAPDVSQENAERAASAADLSRGGILATQLHIVEASSVVLLSPYGGVVTSSSSLILNYHPSLRDCGSVIAYFISSPRPLFIFFATEDNWPVAWYDPLSHLIICHDGVIDLFRDYLQDRVRELKLACLADPAATRTYFMGEVARRTAPPSLMSGMLNYISTHLFSDLQGLMRFAEHLPASAIDSLIVAAPEPFGPTEHLLPEFRDVPVIRDLPDHAVALNHRLWKENRMVVRVTGCVVEQPLADRVMIHAERHADPAWRREVDALVAGGGPVLFLSLRAHGRRWLAPPSAMGQIFNRLGAEHPGLAVIFDGHCVGASPLPKSLTDQEDAMISGIVDHLDGGVRHRVSAGRSMHDSIYAASKATLHLSSQGTSATKSVLIAGLPGVVIGSRQFGWIVTAFRSPCPETILLSNYAIDAEAGNIQCDFTLDPERVHEALNSVLKSARTPS